MSDKSKLMKILQNNCPAIVKIIKLIEVKEKFGDECWLKDTKQIQQLNGKHDSELDHFAIKDRIDTTNKIQCDLKTQTIIFQ